MCPKGASLPERGALLLFDVPFLFQSCYSSAMRYEAVRSNTDKSLHVIFNDDAFSALPDRIRQLGPWQGLLGGAVASPWFVHDTCRSAPGCH